MPTFTLRPRGARFSPPARSAAQIPTSARIACAALAALADRGRGVRSGIYVVVLHGEREALRRSLAVVR
jgi:hypothetical protein